MHWVETAKNRSCTYSACVYVTVMFLYRGLSFNMLYGERIHVIVAFELHTNVYSQLLDGLCAIAPVVD